MASCPRTTYPNMHLCLHRPHPHSKGLLIMYFSEPNLMSMTVCTRLMLHRQEPPMCSGGKEQKKGEIRVQYSYRVHFFPFCSPDSSAHLRVTVLHVYSHEGDMWGVMCSCTKWQSNLSQVCDKHFFQFEGLCSHNITQISHGSIAL